jgi:hypothetical protein
MAAPEHAGGADQKRNPDALSRRGSEHDQRTKLGADEPTHDVAG